jgi:putative transposase
MFKKEENKKLCEKIIQEVAEKHKITIVEMCVMPDHIHTVVEMPPTMSVSRAFHLLKGASSRELFKQNPKFRLRYPRGHFWSPGKFYRTVGDVDAETTINYVKKHRIQQTSLTNFLSPTPAPS